MVNRKILYIILIFFLIVFAGLVYLILGLDDGETENSDLKFETVEQKQTSGFKESGEYVITSENDWQELWNQVYNSGSQLNEPDLPEINFDKEMAIAVFFGEKGSTGYNITIDFIKEFDEYVQISVLEESPDKGCIVGSALTQPFHMVKLPRTDKEISFEHIEQTSECSSPPN